MQQHVCLQYRNNWTVATLSHNKKGKPPENIESIHCLSIFLHP